MWRECRARGVVNPWRLKAAIRAVGLVCILGLSKLAYAEPYQLGHGYDLPFSGLNAGGYLSVQGSDINGVPSKLSLQDLSLFLRKDFTPDWHFFTEIELGRPLVFTPAGLSTSHTDFDIERLYVDHNLSARTTLRIGKFLTPIGRWNQIHADPLVWTVSRPLTTSTAFAKNATGLQIYGTWPLADSSIDYQVFLDNSNDLDPTEGHESVYADPETQPNPPNAFRQGAGARLKYRSLNDDLQIGLSVDHFEMKNQPGYKNLVGADVFYTHNRVEIQSELVYRKDENFAHKTEWGGYVQAVVPLIEHFYGVLAHERYQAELFDEPVNSNIVDITYRPTPPFSIKLEHRQSTGAVQLAPSGWFVSMALLF
ncbi:MAG: hypothetical protein ACYC3A_11210 [Halothiobacillus sp.]